MDEKKVSRSIMVISEDSIDSLCPMVFGISCAFFTLGLLPEPEINDNESSEARTRMLKGSAHLLGLLIWRVQRSVFINARFDLLHKLECAQKQIVELKKRRSEEAKANEKVVSIFAAREQSWFDERKQLRQQIDVLVNDLRVLQMKNNKSLSELSGKLEETEVILQLKDRLMEEVEQRRRETEEKLKKAENLSEELRESVKIEIDRHSCEVSKQKTAYIELASNHHNLEVEMSQALRQVEAAKQEVDSVMEQKEQLRLMNQMLSVDIVKIRKDLEQKDQILSAMTRKLKLDTAEKQMLSQEVKSLKVRGKQAGAEIERRQAVSVCKHEKHSLINMLPKLVREHTDVFSVGKALKAKDMVDLVKFRSLKSECLHLNVDAFAEQLRHKDEKLEAFRWQLMRMELESKRFQSHIEGLNHDIAQLRQDNVKLEAMLLDSETELQSLEELLMLNCSCLNSQKVNSNLSLDNAVRSKGKVSRRRPGHKKQEMKVDETTTQEQFLDIRLTLESPIKEIKEVKASALRPDGSTNAKDIENGEMITSVGIDLSKRCNSTWKMDIHSLGVLYKIKRLKQLLILLERLAGMAENTESSENNSHFGVKGLHALLSSLNKQVDRYQTLQRKIDDLCKRMQEDNLHLNYGGATIVKLEDDTNRLEQFLDETFQLQRYIVATGQKLMEVQAKIASGLAGVVEKPGNIEMKQFADSIKALVREVQRGLEVQVSRIIRDLEGTLTRDSFL